MHKTYYVYILAIKSRMLYIGMTSSLIKRIWEHREKVVDGFAEQFNIDRLVYFEETNDVMAAIEREKQLKKWRRDKKIMLIELKNPTWEDLSAGWTA
jgi:putative endonuclease